MGHEIGHALGLGHENDRSIKAIMYYQTGSNRSYIPTPDDIGSKLSRLA
jgi:hypothetical protein